MRFPSKKLNDLLGDAETFEQPQAYAERENLLLEERVSGGRQVDYLPWISESGSWDEWRRNHERYVDDKVRRRHPLSAAFTPGESSLRPGVEQNQVLLRVELIDDLPDKNDPFGETRAIDIDDNPFLNWGKKLLADPVETINAIITGGGARGTQQRAEPDDFLVNLINYPHWKGQRDSLVQALDDAMIPWLLERSQWELEAIDRFGVRAYTTQLAKGLSVVTRLPLRGAGYRLTEDQRYWDRFCNALRWPGDLDLHWSYNHALIQHQRDERFAPRWFAACDSAAWGSPYWLGQFTTGILGLRKLPPRPNTQPERRVAMALARFALFAGQRGNAKEAERRLHRGAQSMRLLYPRSNEHWAGIWREVLDALPMGTRKDERERLAGWLGDLLPADGGKTGGKRPAKAIGNRQVQLPDADERKELKEEIRRANQISESLWRGFQTLMTKRWAYAEMSGESHFAVRTLNNLGRSLLRLNPNASMLERLHAWTRRAIEAELENAHSWDLWATLLARLGQSEESLAVRWEATRRFPDDPVTQTQLAQLLIRVDKYSVAEHLLRETMMRFPDNAFCRTMLAELLRDDGRTIDAEALLRETMKHFQRDAFCRVMLADMLLDREDSEEAGSEAKQLLEGLEQLAPNNSHVQRLAARIHGDSTVDRRVDKRSASTSPSVDA
ncbi:MAG: hypothetical protein HKP13_02095, partial [Gammaproteobacteria bacterium]|nr:hypothetical protein [Gammaproteobacteria bacterium]